MTRNPFVFSLIALLILALGVTSAVAQEPQSELAATNSGCVAGDTYDPACDVDHNGDINVVDLELVASRWGQSGTWTSSGLWSQAGDNIHYNSGNVGIGTSFPISRLHVDAGGSGTGVRIDSAGIDGVWIISADWNGVQIDSAGCSGVQIDSAGTHGVRIDSADFNGVQIGSTGIDGVEIDSASANGVQIKTAGANGVKIDSAAANGVKIDSADWNGVLVDSAGRDGFACGSGFAGTCFEGKSSVNYAAYFDGHMSVTGSCTGCTLSVFGQNSGPASLEPGDVVAVRGTLATDLQNAATVMEVERAASSSAVIGVVAGWAEVVKDENLIERPERDEAGAEIEAEVPAATETSLRLVPREGPAEPGAYVNIITYGLAQVKASAVTAPIHDGTRLTAADEAGHVRPVRTKMLDDMVVAEGVPVLGIALESLDAGQDRIWVLVNPR